MTDVTDHRVYIALGSNIDPELHLGRAVQWLNQLGSVARVSRVCQSAPVGFSAQADFLNAAILLKTTLAADRLRRALRLIEAELDRIRDPNNVDGPRTIDLDIALYDGPRPDNWPAPDSMIDERLFLAAPLADLDPTLRLSPTGPTLGKIVDDLRARGETLHWRADLDGLLWGDKMPLAVACSSSPPISPFGEPQTPNTSPTSLESRLMPRSTIELRFCYGHRLLNYDGKCKHLHGHTARIELQLSTDRLTESWERQRTEIHQWVHETLDSRMILRQGDPALPALKELGEPVHPIDANPTTENLARLVFLQALEIGLPITQARMWESPRCSAIYLASPAGVVDESAKPDGSRIG